MSYPLEFADTLQPVSALHVISEESCVARKLARATAGDSRLPWRKPPGRSGVETGTHLCVVMGVLMVHPSAR